ncbi:hypothetical protein E4U41_006720 [Claviceps citrina]|nr:hypothetical protein E4U41_006720 [Claviceps citrina]
MAETSSHGEGQDLCRAGAISREAARGNSPDTAYEYDQTASPNRSQVHTERAREQAYKKMMAIDSEMDTMMETPPCSGNKYFLHLQATASLMIADLLTFSSEDATIDAHERAKAIKVQQKANVLLRKVMKHTEHPISSLLDVSVQRIYQNQPQQRKLHMSLPIRGT